MTWTAPSRSDDAHTLYAMAEADRSTNPKSYSLDPAEVIERAVAAGGSVDEFVGDWRTGLEHFCGSAAEDGRLNALGARAIGEQAVSKLIAGAKGAARIDEDPSIATKELLPPIVITGGWRTGTTFLFRLLATDPRLRALLPVDLTQPWRVAGLTATEREELLVKLDETPSPLHFLNPTLRSVHDHGNRLPEECVLAMGVDLRSWGPSSTVRLESYSTWLAGEDLGPSYRAYRRLLQLLDDGDGRRFVLKAPAHTPELRTLVDTFPGAVVVHLHRDIVETIASGASLFAVFRSTFSDEVDPVDVGRFQTDQTELWLRRAAAYADDPHSQGATIIDLAYSDLVASPTTAIARIYEAVGIEAPADPEAFVDAYHRARPRNEHGAHHYAPGDFGLDPGLIRERFAFADRWQT
ncbi:MAG: sulfotransferase [Microthrixaceae bacterium]|nr:sulfotransferase [Microthrixaceae bacterium]